VAVTRGAASRVLHMEARCVRPPVACSIINCDVREQSIKIPLLPYEGEEGDFVVLAGAAVLSDWLPYEGMKALMRGNMTVPCQ